MDHRTGAWVPPKEVGAARLLLLATAFLLPILVIQLQRLLGGIDGFRLEFFAAPAGLEAMIVSIVWWRERHGRITTARARLLHYLAHTVVGLPGTAYLAVGSPVPEAALLRELAVLLLLVERRTPRPMLVQHGALLGGGIFALGFRDWSTPTDVTVWLHLALQLVVFGLAMATAYVSVSIRQRWVALAIRAERSRRAHAAVAERLGGLLGIVAPVGAARFLLQGRAPPVEHGSYLCVTFDCSGAHAAHDFFKSHSTTSERAGIEDFLLEWQRFVGYVEELGRPLGMRLERGATFLRQEKRLIVQDAAPGTATATAHLTEGLVYAREVAAFAARSLRSMRGRGQEGWTTPCTVEIIQASASAAPSDPVWTLRGASIGASEEFLTGLRPLRLPDRVWLLESQFEGVAALFLEADLVRRDGRVGAGLLSVQYSVDGRGIHFVPDLRHRLAYHRLGESD